MLSGKYSTGVVSRGADSANSTGTLVTSGAANTKGSWVALGSALPFNVNRIKLFLARHSGTTHAVDLGFGTGGTFKVLVPDILYNTSQSRQTGVVYDLPMQVPAGMELGVRFQTGAASDTLKASALCQAGVGGYTCAKTYGMTTSGSTAATVVTAGAVAHVDTAWTTLAASLTLPVKALSLCVTDLDGGSAETEINLDLGIGVDPSAVSIIEDIYMIRDNAFGFPTPHYHGPFDFDIPSGKAISFRFRCNQTASPNTRLRASLITFS